MSKSEEANLHLERHSHIKHKKKHKSDNYFNLKSTPNVLRALHISIS